MQAKHKLMFYCVLILIRVIFAAPPPALVPITGGAALKGAEDSAYSGVPWPKGRFVQIKGTNGQPGCTLDKLTGLVWLGEISEEVSKVESDIKSANNSKYCGYSDWRWSNMVEIKSLIHWGREPNDDPIGWYVKNIPVLKEVFAKDYVVAKPLFVDKTWILDFKNYQIRQSDGYDLTKKYVMLLVRGGYREP